MDKIIKTFKGFDKNLCCRGMQYEIGKSYEEPNAEVCNKGFHACERPLDVFKNAKITSASLSMSDHGCLTSNICLEGAGWACCYGGYCLGHGYLGAKKFDGSSKGVVSLMRIMDTVGVEKWEDLKDKFIRVATKNWGDTIKIIGNIIKDKWFDYESFFKEEENG